MDKIQQAHAVLDVVSVTLNHFLCFPPSQTIRQEKAPLHPKRNIKIGTCNVKSTKPPKQPNFIHSKSTMLIKIQDKNVIVTTDNSPPNVSNCVCVHECVHAWIFSLLCMVFKAKADIQNTVINLDQQTTQGSGNITAVLWDHTLVTIPL